MLFNFTFHEKHAIKGEKNRFITNLLWLTRIKNTQPSLDCNPPAQPPLLTEHRDVRPCLSPVSKHLFQAVMESTAAAE